MNFVISYYFGTIVVLLITHETIFPVKGQCTVQGCDNGDPLISIVAEIQQLRVELFDQLNKQVQSINELNASFQEIKSSVMTSLQEVDRRRSWEHDINIKQSQSIHEFLNESFQEMKSLQAGDRLSQKHDICVKQVQSIRELFNESVQQTKSQHDTVMNSLQEVDRRSQESNVCIKDVTSIHALLNQSIQEMKSQHDTVNMSLQAVDRRLQNYQIDIKNQTQKSWKLVNDIWGVVSPVRDCSDIKARGYTVNGVYEVCVGHQPNRVCTNAFCDMETNNSAFLVFQRRKDGSVNFNRTWSEYKQGFGNTTGEFWLGNEMLYLLTSKRNYKLRIDMEDFTGAKRYAEYARFSINSSDDNYRLTVRGYSGNAGDSLYYNNGKQFTTNDVDNDDLGGINCARTYGGAWWHKDCSYAHLNGICRPTSEVCDCSDIKASGQIASGVYEVCAVHQGDRVCTNAFCDMDTTNGTSLVFQRRKNGSVNFYRTWSEYKEGFGDLNGEYWLGNEMLYLLTSKRNYKLHIHLEDFEGNKRFAEYRRFSIRSSIYNYTLEVGGYSGNAGDCLRTHNGQQFSTKDADNDKSNTSSCAHLYSGAWWYNRCHDSNLNGIYHQGNYSGSGTGNKGEGIVWSHWLGIWYSLKSTDMKLIPVP